MQLSVFFNLIRWKNLLLIIYVQLVIKFLFLPYFNTNSQLQNWQFLILLAAILFLTAAGYIINDFYDIATDHINKPSKNSIGIKISKEKAILIYQYFNILGISFGAIICFSLQKPSLFFIFLTTALLLYYYSKYLKALPLIGNFIVAFLIALSIFLLAIFDINHSQKTTDYNFVIATFSMVSFFAFCLNFIREILKDIEDVNGDYYLNMNTLPILIGRNRAKKLVLILTILTTSILIIFLLFFAGNNKIIAIYTVVFIIIPLLYIASKILNLSSPKKIHKISMLLKLVMFFGCNIFILLSFTQ